MAGFDVDASTDVIAEDCVVQNFVVAGAAVGGFQVHADTPGGGIFIPSLHVQFLNCRVQNILNLSSTLDPTINYFSAGYAVANVFGYSGLNEDIVLRGCTAQNITFPGTSSSGLPTS